MGVSRDRLIALKNRWDESLQGFVEHNGMRDYRPIMVTTRKLRAIGRYIVCDPRIRHGKPTFRGTRVPVADVLDQVASGMAWETIVEEWNDSVSHEAIREAVQLASQALAMHTDDFVVTAKSA